MQSLYACPFCRQLFTQGEVSACPDCDLGVRPLAELPPSLEAEALEEEDPTAPEDELRHVSDLRRGRGALLLTALCGLGAFAGPWFHETTPEIMDLSGFGLARQLGYIWAAVVAWLVMIALVASRRTIRQMRGARVAVGFLAGMVLVTVAARLLVPIASHPLIRHRYSWGWGMYLAGLLSLLALGLAIRFGGSLADMPSAQARRRDETVH